LGNMAQTPVTLEAAVDAALKRAKEMLADDGWTVFSDDGTTLLESKNYPGCSINAFRATTLLTGSPADCAAANWGMKVDEMQKVDSGITSNVDVEVISDSFRVRCQNNSLPWPIWPRQTLYAEKNVKEDTGFWQVACSVLHPKSVTDTSQFVATTLQVGLFAFILDEKTGKTRMWRLIQIEPNGSLPAVVVNSNADNVAAYCRHFRGKFPSK